MKIIISLTTIVLITLIALTILPQLPYTADTPDSYQVIVLDMWHIESSEGGKGSRSGWIATQLKALEQSHKGLYVNLHTLTVSQALDMLDSGEVCDIVSFGMGVGQYLLPHLVPMAVGVDTLDNVAKGGTVDNIQYATPYMTGIYGLLGRDSDLDQLGIEDIVKGALHCATTKKVGKNIFAMYSLQCGYTSYNNPLQALYISGVEGQLGGIDYNITQYKAYDNFVSNRYATLLLGTQRDIYRVNNRIEQGRLGNITYSPLPYTDLVQYLGVCSSGDADMCIDIVKHFVSSSVQYSLSNIGMLATTDIQPYSTNKWLEEAQNTLRTASVANVFCDDAVIASDRDSVREYYMGNH